jgi:hypothetical protein
MRVLGEKHMRAILLARFFTVSLLLCSGFTFAAEPLFLEDAQLVPLDGSPQGRFGSSIDIDGDVAVVGATDGAGMPEQGRPGAAYVFERQSHGVWRQVAKLLPLYEEPEGPGASNFGTSVAVEGDVIVVGCYFSPQTTVFERRNGVWTRAAVLSDTGGQDVDIHDGTIITSSLLGADIYRRGPSGWTRVQRLQNGLPMPDADYVGPSVAISATAAIHGSYGNDNEIDPYVPGTAYIYPLGADHTWQGGPVAAITDPEGGGIPDSFSAYVDISGSTAIIYAFPLPYVFERDAQGVWNPVQAIDGALGIDGDTILASPTGRGSRVYRRTSAGAWTHQASLAASTGGLESLAVKGNRVIAAGGGYNIPRTAYVFTLPDEFEPKPAMVEEDLEDGAANGWIAQPNSTFSVASVGGTRVYRQTSTVTGASAIYESADWDRQSIQADVTPRAYATGSGDRWFGLMVRHTDANNYYYITVRNSNTIQLKRMQNGVHQTLASLPLQVALNRAYPLRLEAHGEHLRVFVEGRQVIDAFDGALTHGRAGITMYRTQADFDNLILNPDPSRVLKDDRFNMPKPYVDWENTHYENQWVERPSEGVFVQPTIDGGAHAVTGSEHSGDQIIRARMRATQFSGADRWFGLIGRYVDASNYYYVTVRSSNNISLRKLTDGAITTLDTATMPVAVNTWYDLRLEIVGTKLRAYVNGRLILEANDSGPPHVAGYSGVGSYKTAAQADDFLTIQP